MNSTEQILESIILPNGLNIDLDEGFVKITERQFGGKPGRGFSELLQNAIDSYPVGTPWKDRYGEIKSGHDWISMTDYGEGMDTKRLSLLATLGGTDKYGDPEKIGQFGMGFMSMFNPKLGTIRITVITRCEGNTVELVFTVADPKKRPVIALRVLEEEIKFSTRIKVEFSKAFSVNDCLEHAKNHLRYYPCHMVINGEVQPSVWESAKDRGEMIFTEGPCHGLIKKSKIWRNASIMCRYELIYTSTLDTFVTGGHNMKNNLDDLASQGTPYIDGIEVLLNINNLRVTISRDSYYLDYAFSEAVRQLNLNLRIFLAQELDTGIAVQHLLANQFIFRNELVDYLTHPDNETKYFRPENKIITFLAESKVYRINGRAGYFSIADLYDMMRPGIPFYFSPEKTNLRWLGGAFKHNFIVIPDECVAHSGADNFYDRLFSCVFRDVVNLDTIKENPKKIIELVERGIVSREALSPECKIIGSKKLVSNEENLLNDISDILKDPAIMEAIGKNLHLPLSTITPVFFSVEEQGALISTGLFDKEGKPISDKFISNFADADKCTDIPPMTEGKKANIMLGLNLDHPFIRYLAESRNAQRGYYTLTYLAHELTLCQKLLVPYSPFYHLVKEKLAQDMRTALMKNLLVQLKN
jgi:hypothetical protein